MWNPPQHRQFESPVCRLHWLSWPRTPFLYPFIHFLSAVRLTISLSWNDDSHHSHHLWPKCSRQQYGPWRSPYEAGDVYQGWSTRRCWFVVGWPKWLYGSLGVHMEKCIFIGYPQGYKGWMFYNPETKKALISEHANFDECFFMLQKHSVSKTRLERPLSDRAPRGL